MKKYKSIVGMMSVILGLSASVAHANLSGAEMDKKTLLQALANQVQAHRAMTLDQLKDYFVQEVDHYEEVRRQDGTLSTELMDEFSRVRKQIPEFTEAAKERWIQLEEEDLIALVSAKKGEIPAGVRANPFFYNTRAVVKDPNLHIAWKVIYGFEAALGELPLSPFTGCYAGAFYIYDHCIKK